jgi:BlaI family penicillinase repressor
MIRAKHHHKLSRRERQIMDILYRLERATASEVQAQLSGEPAYSTVRAQLRVLEEKGELRHAEEGLRYVYMPKQPKHQIQQSALRHLVETLFEGSADKVVAALLGKGSTTITDEQLERMAELIAQARKDGKRK